MTVPVSEPPLFTFGLISDIQWADCDDGHSIHGVPRYYRHALEAAHRAVAAFRSAGVDLAVHLGDIVDYRNKHNGSSERALEAVIACFDALERPVLHCIGNHCLYNAPRHVLNSKLGIDAHKEAAAVPGKHSYFTFKPPNCTPQYKIVVLDGFDVSILGWPEGHPHHEQAREILEQKNPNDDKNSNRGLQGMEKRFVKFGGGISDEQLAWLESELKAARAAGERVIVCCHQCIHPETAVATCMLYNYDVVLRVLQQYPDVVSATLAGHAHMDGYHLDEFGIHHRCANSPVGM